MSAQTPRDAPHDDPGQHAADTRAHRDALCALISMGTDLARLLHGQATALATIQAQAAQEATAPRPAAALVPDSPVSGAPLPNAPVPDTLVTIAAAFDSTARGVRRGVLLARSLAQPVQPATPAPDPAAQRAAARRRILREVEDTIQRPGGNGRGGPALDDSLRAELRDRLDGPDLDDDIAGRPVADIITEIRRDLGLDAHPGTRPFQRRTPDDIRQLCARAAAPSAARQPGAGPQKDRPQDPRPQDPRPRDTGPRDTGRDATERPPGPQPDQSGAVPRAQPSPVHAGSGLPDDPAEAIAMILRHHTRARARWRPPPEA